MASCAGYQQQALVFLRPPRTHFADKQEVLQDRQPGFGARNEARNSGWCCYSTHAAEALAAAGNSAAPAAAAAGAAEFRSSSRNSEKRGEIQN